MEAIAVLSSWVVKHGHISAFAFNVKIGLPSILLFDSIGGGGGGGG